MGLPELLKPFEQSLIVQLLVGVAIAGVFAWRVVEQFRKGMSSEPPPKPGQGVVEAISITDMQPWRDMVQETRRCADALEKIAESFRIFNKREETEDERSARESDRKEREDMRRLVEQIRDQMDRAPRRR